jgi:hypothetical protein
MLLTHLKGIADTLSYLLDRHPVRSGEEEVHGEQVRAVQALKADVEAAQDQAGMTAPHEDGDQVPPQTELPDAV